MNCKILLKIDKKNIPEQSKSKENVKKSKCCRTRKTLQQYGCINLVCINEIEENINKKVIYKKKKMRSIILIMNY